MATTKTPKLTPAQAEVLRAMAKGLTMYKATGYHGSYWLGNQAKVAMSTGFALTDTLKAVTAQPAEQYARTLYYDINDTGREALAAYDAKHPPSEQPARTVYRVYAGRLSTNQVKKETAAYYWFDGSNHRHDRKDYCDTEIEALNRWHGDLHNEEAVALLSLQRANERLSKAREDKRKAGKMIQAWIAKREKTEEGVTA